MTVGILTPGGIRTGTGGRPGGGTPGGGSGAQYSEVTVVDVIGDPAGGVVGKATVRVWLVADVDRGAVYLPVGQLSVLSRKTIELDETDEGAWSITLVPNSLLSPASHYEVLRSLPDGSRDPQPLRFTVPDTLPAGTGSVWLRDLLTFDAGVSTGTSATALQAQVSALRPQLTAALAENQQLTTQAVSQQQQIQALSAQLAAALTAVDGGTSTTSGTDSIDGGTA